NNNNNKQVDYMALDGLGAGQFGRFVNSIFVDGAAENTIGEVEQIAFNDFLQTWVELGYVGLFGLILVGAGVSNRRMALPGAGLVLVTGAMFPLQYPESAGMWLLVVLALRDQSALRLISGRWWRVGGVAAAGLLFGLGSWWSVQYGRWAAADANWQAGVRDAASYRELGEILRYDANFQGRLGQVSMAVGEVREANAAFSRAVALSPSYALLRARADFYSAQHQLVKAHLDYQSCQRLRPQLLYPAYREVQCLVRLGKPQAAQARREALLAKFTMLHNPQDYALYSELAHLSIPHASPSMVQKR
ncbi:MAG: hypothetical protein AAF570_26105, partial [Bacteroidota bacterium]